MRVDTRVLALARMPRLRAAASTATIRRNLAANGGLRDFEVAFAALVQQRVRALLLAPTNFFNDRLDQLVAFATRHQIPTLCPWREFAVRGGLMSYGTIAVNRRRLICALSLRTQRACAPRLCHCKQCFPMLRGPLAGYSLTFFGIVPIFLRALHCTSPINSLSLS